MHNNDIAVLAINETRMDSTIPIELIENWEDVYDANDVDDKVQCFNEIIGNMLDTYTPAKGVRMHPNDKEWMTPYIKTQIRARQKAFTKGDKYEYTLGNFVLKLLI